jgi:hypothetical protein
MTTLKETATRVSSKDELKLRCFELSLQIKQQESMHRFQMWNQAGKQGDMPDLHTREEVYEDAQSLYDFISETE